MFWNASRCSGNKTGNAVHVRALVPVSLLHQFNSVTLKKALKTLLHSVFPSENDMVQSEQ